MKTTQNRTWSFPPKAEANLEGEKACKRFVYNSAYFLFTYAYRPAYHPAYLQAIEQAGSRLMAQMRLVLRMGKIAHPGASY